MTIGKIKSSTIEAKSAISELTGLKNQSSFKTVEFGSSNISSMITGKTLANELMTDISKITSCVLAQANKFPELAEHIEMRDKQDAKGWS